MIVKLLLNLISVSQRHVMKQCAEDAIFQSKTTRMCLHLW